MSPQILVRAALVEAVALKDDVLDVRQGEAARFILDALGKISDLLVQVLYFFRNLVTLLHVFNLNL